MESELGVAGKTRCSGERTADRSAGMESERGVACKYLCSAEFRSNATKSTSFTQDFLSTYSHGDSDAEGDSFCSALSGGALSVAISTHATLGDLEHVDAYIDFDEIFDSVHAKRAAGDDDDDQSWTTAFLSSTPRPASQPVPHSLRVDSPARALIAIDWDDTLLPTSWLRCMRKGQPVFNVENFNPRLLQDSVQKEWFAYVDSVLSLMRTARSLGHIAIVTSAKRKWVSRSSKTYLPKLLQAEEDLDVYFAEEVDAGPSYVPKASAAKQKLECMLMAIEAARQKHPIGSFVSIGDSVVESCAAKWLCENCISTGEVESVKSVRFVSSPTLRALTKQLLIVADRLPDLVVQSGNICVRTLDLAGMF